MKKVKSFMRQVRSIKSVRPDKGTVVPTWPRIIEVLILGLAALVTFPLTMIDEGIGSPFEFGVIRGLIGLCIITALTAIMTGIGVIFTRVGIMLIKERRKLLQAH